ncbi:hypothetical protein JW933_07875 [candidate division FCPU426 bacterium]|nr:hypothetical protein [candidate division FCPU426 bacterium]
MKKNILVFCLACLLIAWNAPACQAKPRNTASKTKLTRSESSAPTTRGRHWGFGLIIGDPTGITAKYWQNESIAYDFALGAQLAGAGVSAHADYLYHLCVFPEVPEAPMYVGGGLFLGGSSDVISTGGRGVVGMTYLFKEPFDVFMQLSPNLSLLPEVGFFFTFSIGVRIYI